MGDLLIEIHHVGSTAVQDLAAKPEIDLLVEVSTLDQEAHHDEEMIRLGYVRGFDLSAEHQFYRRGCRRCQNAQSPRLRKRALADQAHAPFS